jgi:hypothetical protein
VPSFPATFSVTNTGRVDHPITLAGTSTNPLANNIVFRLYDSAGTLLWESIPLLTPTVTATGNVTGSGDPIIVTLPHRKAWRRTVLVPLMIDGKLLADGQYRLDAAINGTPVFSATASLLVKNVDGTPPPPPTGTGIKGTALVGPVTPVATPGAPNEQPLPGARIQVKEKRQLGVFYIYPPFSTVVVADDQGKFSVDTPAGTFEVTGLPPDPSSPFPIGSSQTVLVTAGAYTEITVHYDSGIR